MRNLILAIFILSTCLSLSNEWVEYSEHPLPLSFGRIEAIDEMNHTIGGNKGLIDATVIRTTDGGKNYEVIFTDTIKQYANRIIRFQSLHHEHEDHYLIMCSGGHYRYSSDAGKTWKFDSLLTGSSAEISATSFNNSVFIYFEDTAYYSSDYGNTWESFEYNIDHDYDLDKGKIVMHNYSYIDSETIIAELSYFIDFYHEDNVYSTLVSKDNGRNWKIIYTKELFNTFNYSVGENGRIIGVGSRQVEPYKSPKYDIIKYSDDGGFSWTTVLDTVTEYYPTGLSQVKFNKNFGVAFQRERGKVWMTTDYGETWKLDKSIEIADYHPNDYYIFDNGEIIATSRVGKTYKWADPTLSAGSEFVANPKSILLYPNPTNPSDGVNVEFTAHHSGLVEIALIDITGKRVSSIERQAISGTELKYRFTPKEKLASGVYFIQIGYKNGEAYREKLVVE